MSSIKPLKYRELGVNAAHEFVAYLSANSEARTNADLRAQSRIQIYLNDKAITATVQLFESNILNGDEIGLSRQAARSLGADSGDYLHIEPALPAHSLTQLRSRIYGHRCSSNDFSAILSDILAGKYTNTQIAAFVTALAAQAADAKETAALTHSMVAAGDRVLWHSKIVADKHCVGGLPGNRTTPIVVAIVSACGVTIPKTSSRAITSPAGTADVLEVLTPVTLSLDQMRNVVQEQGGCFVWGGAFTLSPADAILIGVARALELDSDTQLVASVLSKKIAAGASHVLIDIPIGKTAKVRTLERAQTLRELFEFVGRENSIAVRVLFSDGSVPVGHGIGPALEARDVLQVLRNEALAPQDLRQKSLLIASELLEFSGVVKQGEGLALASQTLDSGIALEKFLSICRAQGGYKEPSKALHSHQVFAAASGKVSAIHNRHLSRLAFLLGAPEKKTAGVDLHARSGDQIEKGQRLMTLHAETESDLDKAQDYLSRFAVYELTP